MFKNDNSVNKIHEVLFDELDRMENGEYADLIRDCRKLMSEAGVDDKDQQDTMMVLNLLQETTMEIVNGRNYVDKEVFYAMMKMSVSGPENMDPEEFKEILLKQGEDSSENIPFTLKDVLLMDNDEFELGDLADEFNVFCEFNASQEEKAEKLAQEMLDPALLRENLLVLHDTAINQLQDLMAGMTIETAQNDLDLRDEWPEFTEYGWFSGDDRFAITPDVRDALKQFDTQEFFDERERMTWLNDCMHVFASWYGAGPVSLMRDLYNASSVWHADTDKEIAAMVRKMPKHLRIVETYRKGLCASGFKKYKEARESLEQVHEKYKGAAVPSAKEITSFARNSYPEDHPCYRAMREFITPYAEGEEEIREFMRDLFNLITVHGTYYEVLELLDSSLVHLPSGMRPEFTFLYILTSNHSPKMALSGKTPAMKKAEDGNGDYFIVPDAATAKGRKENERFQKKYAYLEQECSGK